MSPTDIAAMEEELKRDLDALARVRRIFEARGGDNSATAPVVSFNIEPTPQPVENTADEEGPVTSLRGKIEEIINADPEAKWTTQKVCLHLNKIGFPLNAQKPIYSIGQALSKNVEQGRIRLARKGSGSTPNIYKGVGAVPHRGTMLELPLLEKAMKEKENVN